MKLIDEEILEITPVVMRNAYYKDKPNLRGLKYSPQTGIIYRNIPSNNRFQGPAKSTNNNGYKIMAINGASYVQHRVACWLMGLEIPKNYQVDHINGAPSDNRWDNLRIVSPSANTSNLKKHREGKISYLDFRADRGKWRVKRSCPLTRRQVHYGYFKRKEDAVVCVEKLMEASQFEIEKRLLVKKR